MKISFYDLEERTNLKYVVIISEDKSGKVYVQHKDRDTWEIPSGHIEMHESPDNAAKRELIEETGAQEITLEAICDYSVYRENKKSFGRLYYSFIKSYSRTLQHEIEHVRSFDELPQKLTYPKIQPHLLEEVMRRKAIINRHQLKKYPVRTSAKALIIKDNHILAIKHHQNSHDYFALPGGGQNHNEDLRTALHREYLEEVGAEIEIQDIILVRDYIADNHEFAQQDPGFHQLELIFRCSILNPNTLHSQTEPDKHQIGIEWLPMQNIEGFPLYPKAIKEKIRRIHMGHSLPIYIGDVN